MWIGPPNKQAPYPPPQWDTIIYKAYSQWPSTAYGACTHRQYLRLRWRCVDVVAADDGSGQGRGRIDANETPHPAVSKLLVHFGTFLYCLYFYLQRIISLSTS